MPYSGGMAYIRKVKTASGATAIQIAHKNHGRITRIEHIGSAHTDEELQILLSLAKSKLPGSQQSLFKESDPSLQIELKQSSSAILLQTLMAQYIQLGFDNLADEDFAYLCMARIVEPVSKLDSLRVLVDLGVYNLSKDKLYRCLARIVKEDYRTKIAKLCFKRANQNSISLVLYDVTTLYFEIQKEDEYRKPGMSKERRLEPQIIVGMLVDQNGFPLAVHSFEGNRAETTTILPVVEQFKNQHGLSDITVVADAGMLSAKNLDALASAGYHYIVGSRLQKIPYDIAEYRKTKKLTDKQIISTKLTDVRRVIYQYSEKRAALDKRNIEKQIAKANKIASGKLPSKKTKFLIIKTKEKRLNLKLIEKAYILAGIKGYVTDLEIADEQVINHYHQLWRVEASFRMSKSDLRARPIFHHKRESIEAHLTIVFASLAISKTVEVHTKTSIKKFVKTLRTIRSGIVTINGKDYIANPHIPAEIKRKLLKLSLGH